jgi:hypothetical protein
MSELSAKLEYLHFDCRAVKCLDETFKLTASLAKFSDGHCGD